MGLLWDHGYKTPFFRASSLMDYVMKTSEKYASGLEEMVQEKMRQLAEEKKRTDELVCRLLPK